MKLRFTVRDPSKQDMDSYLAISEMANPELHMSLKKIYSTFSDEQMQNCRMRLLLGIANYIDFAVENANSYIQAYLNDIEIEPDRREQIFLNHRDHYVSLIKAHRKFSYLYIDYYKKEGGWNIDLLNKLANAIWDIVYNHNERLIDGLWLFQRIYSYYFTVEELNAHNNKHLINLPIINTSTTRTDQNSTRSAETEAIPKIYSDNLTEPKFDQERLKSDYLYRYNKVKEFRAFIDLIDIYEEKIKYYLHITRQMGLIPTLMGSITIFDRATYTRNGKSDGPFFDKDGNEAAEISWGINYINDEQRSIKQKLWFLNCKNEQFTQVGRFKNVPVDELKKDYYKGLESTIDEQEYVLQQLEFTNNRINELMYYVSHNIEWGSRINAEIKKAHSKASDLVYKEILGIKAIDWTLFYSAHHFMPFAFIWELIEYKIFLQKEVRKIGKENVSNGKRGSEDNSKYNPIIKAVGFESVIKNSDKLIPFLITNYKGAKPKQICFMIYALIDLDLIERSTLTANQTELHRLLTITFGNVGTRQSLQNNISNLESASGNEERSINQHKKLIKAFLEAN